MKKILLASCVAAISAGVNAELTPLSEYELHTVTGQAGIDIELDVGVSIGEVRYTDTEVITQEIIQVDPDGDGVFEDQIIDVSDGDGGSLVISNIFLGGDETRTTLLGKPTSTPNTSNLDNLKFAVDIQSDGDLIIDGQPAGGGVVDFLLKTGEIALESADRQSRHVLVDSLSIYGGALGFKMVVDGETNDIRFEVEASVDDMDIDMSSLGINISNAMIKDSTFIERGGIDNPSGLLISQHTFIVNMNMSKTEDGEGVKFEFLKDPFAPVNDFNVFDVYVEELSIGGGLVGSIAIDDLDINGVSFVVSGHP